VLNGVFIALILSAVLTAAFTGRMPAVNTALLEKAKYAVVDVAIPLVGAMALWLGLMRVLRDAGLMASIARGLAPLMRRLFPDVPTDHPAMGAMIMNISANMLGLGNAATPFGLKAMQELDRLNPRKGVATDSMALFLAINTSGVAVLPLGVVAIRSSLGSQDAGGIIIPSILATLCSTVVAVLVARTLAGRRGYAVERYPANAEGEAPPGAGLADAVRGLDEAEAIASERAEFSRPGLVALVLFVAAVLAAMVLHLGQEPAAAGEPTRLEELGKSWLLPLLMGAIAVFGMSRRVKVYDSFIRGAREGFEIAVMIIPFLVGILVAIGMFRASGAFDLLMAAVNPVTSLIGFPPEALPMALVRPLSGGGAMGVMTETLQEYGPDSFVGYLVSVLNGSTETTFYVLALYYGSVRVRAVRHTLAACLAADATAALAALLWCRVFFG
jgi:spore maturation protein SpmA